MCAITIKEQTINLKDNREGYYGRIWGDKGGKRNVMMIYSHIKNFNFFQGLYVYHTHLTCEFLGM